MRSSWNVRLALPLTIVAIAAMAVLAACGGDKAATTSGATTTPSPTESAMSSTMPSMSAMGTDVTIANYAYGPDTVTVPAGTTVMWTNNDSVAHTVTAADGIGTDAAPTGLFDSGLLEQGATFSYTFTTSGTYYYLCTPHASMPAMHAQVIVE